MFSGVANGNQLVYTINVVVYGEHKGLGQPYTGSITMSQIHKGVIR